MTATIPATLLYGGLSALLLLALGFNVSRLRGAARAGPGAVPPELVRPVRAHGNAAEWMPVGLLLLLALELSGGPSRFALHLLGGGFLLARVLHAAGLYGRNRLSVAGAGITYLLILVMGGWATVLGLSR